MKKIPQAFESRNNVSGEEEKNLNVFDKIRLKLQQKNNPPKEEMLTKISHLDDTLNTDQPNLTSDSNRKDEVFTKVKRAMIKRRNF
mmetsp:Transcript_17522/g.15442  ORF Transcript_17522/g.15442 Transcript_17522/m.15442 type:complete len:86 (+) Transcript_17522:741-998(+)